MGFHGISWDGSSELTDAFVEFLGGYIGSDERVKRVLTNPFDYRGTFQFHRRVRHKRPRVNGELMASRLRVHLHRSRGM
jgi:hypothetical protein